MFSEDLKRLLYLFAGVDEGDSSFQLKEMSPEELRGMKTVCGHIDKKEHFTEKAIHFLRAKAKKVLAVIWTDEDGEEFIAALAAPISEEEGEEFSRLVEAAGGSLRPEYDPRFKMCVFESE